MAGVRGATHGLPRRGFVAGAGLSLAGLFLVDGLAAQEAAEAEPFSRSTVLALARRLAAEPFERPEPPVPQELAQIGYSGYHGIRFKETARVWQDAGLAFTVDLMHSGFIYNISTEMFVVEDGRARKIAYAPDLFDFAPGVPVPAPDTPLEFAGFRARTHLNGTDYWDEFAVFAGASYFRAVAKGQVYGLSARGLAINTAEPEGEEFPFFRAFWLERPDTGRLVVHALLDSPSATGAYRFTIQPGDATVMDVEAQVFTRSAIKTLGLGSLTSMYLYGLGANRGADDFRPSVHDSDGLSMWNGRDEWLWRPLQNPSQLQISAFIDTGLRGFGLLQRRRDFGAYEDLEALYHKRPSLWVEPIGDWQTGAVVLVEIPTDQEIHDNIVAFWSPDGGLAANAETSFTYRLYWCWEPPQRPNGAIVAGTLFGVGSNPNLQRFVVDFVDPAGGDLRADGIEAQPSSSVGKIENVVLRDNPEINGVRVSFELDPQGESLAECRVDLMREGRLLGESWVYRWTA